MTLHDNSNAVTERQLLPDVVNALPSNIVLLADAVNTAGVDPSRFAHLGIARPTNAVLTPEFILLDYGSLQCVVLPGVPRRLQVQVAAGHSLLEARGYALELFRFAGNARTGGLNFGHRFEFRDAGPPVLHYMNIPAISELVGADPISVGFTARFAEGPWRGQLTVSPGANEREVLVQVNYERDLPSHDAIPELVDAIEERNEAQSQLVGRVQWRS